MAAGANTNYFYSKGGIRFKLSRIPFVNTKPYCGRANTYETVHSTLPHKTTWRAEPTLVRPCIPPVHTGPRGGQSERLWDRAFHPSTQEHKAGIANTCETVYSTHPHRTTWGAEPTLIGLRIPPVHTGTHGGQSERLWDRAFHRSTQDRMAGRANVCGTVHSTRPLRTAWRA